MNKKIIQIFIGLLLILSIPMLGFLQLSDLNQAQLTLKLLGVGKTELTEISNLILDNNYTKFKSRADIPERDKELLINYHKKSTQSPSNLHIADLYLSKHEERNKKNTTSISTLTFDYLYSAKDAIIICSTSGGCASSNWYEFYKVESNQLKLIGELSLLSDKMLTLALCMRFEENMVEWNKHTIPNL